MINQLTEKLFSYGTLQYEKVQLATFGRKLHGVPDVLLGYKLSIVEIKDPDVVVTSGDAAHPILIFTGSDLDRVQGIVFDITPEELQLADQYEVSDYKRVAVTLLSGLHAWVYISVT